MKIVWVPVRHGTGRFVYHDTLDCGQARGRSVPTGIEFAERAGLERCAYCAKGGCVQERRRVIVELRKQGLTFAAIALRLAVRWDVSRSSVHKDYQRAMAERAA